MTVGYLVAYAYGVEPLQITGPEWTTGIRFDIEARFPEGVDMKEDRQMLQVFLKDRFKLAFHTEKRELDAYILTVGKHGEKLKPSLPELATPETGAPLNLDGSTTPRMDNKRTQTVTFDQEKWAQHFEVSKMTMEQLANTLGICVGPGVHKVFDETGLKGTYQVIFDCPVPRPQRPVSTGVAGTLPPDPEDGSALTRSLDMLGLKLERRKVPMDIYVIDHAEKPAEN